MKREEQDQLRENTEQGTVHSDGNELWMERRPSALWNVRKKNYRNEIPVMSTILRTVRQRVGFFFFPIRRLKWRSDLLYGSQILSGCCDV